MNEYAFINDFISFGLAYYFDKKGDYLFEGHVIECLCDIYGRDNLQRIYEAKDESAFIDLMKTYGLANSLYDNFLRDTNLYEKFRIEKLNDPSIKSDILSKVEHSLITMFIYKCFLMDPTLEEISHFENDLLNNFEMIKFHFNASVDPNRTREVWSKKKRMLDDNVTLVKIVPNYLDDFTYAKYGTSRAEVEKMDYRMVEELNSYIASKQALDGEINEPVEKRKVSLFANTALSSGNGFVDALLVASIIATELSIGLIYLFLHF